ncbi:hypothetical protein RUM43_005360 [Polyplax serrata]|uniref:CCZ1/INTU/HSP4 first Longin domain-containing protein n=1 Tax=Polyplax serrata TaxID=468196 RepID=A0AAN8NWL0_POLSC
MTQSFCREQVIVFVYDTGYCQTEADDPQKAVLFFHPHWVSDQQRLALCGQLMGAAHFCSLMFSTPRVLTLQCGKFSVGSDQTLPEWILQERFKNLELLFQFYHNSFDSIFNRVDCDQDTFSKKLTEILGTFIPILQCVVCAFGNVFVLKCPKKNSSAFLEAFQLLEACCNFKGVLGGVILHSSRVVATQLDSDITKLLALTNKFHLKSYAEEVKPSFKLPDGIQLLKVYLRKELHNSLHNTANFKWTVYNGVQKKFLQKAGKIGKKDASKIFTVKEDEDWNGQAVPKQADAFAPFRDSVRFKNRNSKSNQEKNALKERSKSFVGGANVKVCSTPTVEKTLIHEELVSICGAGKVEPKKANITTNLIPDVVQDAIDTKFRSRILTSSKYSHNRFFRISMDDLMIDFSQKSYPVPLKYYSFGLPKTYREVGLSMKANRERRKLRRKTVYKTIADPMNPVFKYDGIPVSKCLYNTYLDEHYKDFILANHTIDSREEEFLKNKHSERENLNAKVDVDLTNVENKIGDALVNRPEPQMNGKETPPVHIPEGKRELTRANQKAFRRSLSLPLKPLVCDTPNTTTQSSTIKNKVLFSRTPTTPLTTKLSLLAFEEQQLEIKSTLPTPGEKHFRGIMTSHAGPTAEGTQKNIETIPASLFLFAHQNMTIMLLLDEGLEKNSEMIHSLWEASSTTLKKVEHVKNKGLPNLSSSGSKNSAYSFLSLDSHWGAVQRSGPWGDEELKVVGSLHHDLNKSSNITEIIVRNEDSVVYGYSCGGTKIFYQQGGCSSAGLPTPADLMGMVTLNARKRLERDRDVVIL